MRLLPIAWASLLSRKANALLTITAIAISVMLLLGVERVSEQTRAGFANTISGTDLIVGARSGQVNLLLFSVFHIGNPTANVSWQSYQHWSEHDQVAWAVPIALGDSFQGHPVIATDNGFFEHVKYGQRQPLRLAQGESFSAHDDAVLGARVARQQALTVGDHLVVAHGTGRVSFHQHDDDPLTVRGVLAPTGTPIDNAVFVPLQALATMHGEAEHNEPHAAADADNAGRPSFSDQQVPEDQGSRTGHHEQHADDNHQQHEHSHENEHSHDQPIETLSAFYLGLHSQPRAIFMQRLINTWGQEPLTAAMPGATLQEMWRTLNVFEQALTIVSGFVLLTGLIGMLATLLASLQERRREMAVLRSVGAGPASVFTLLVSEAFVLTLLGIVVGVLLLYLGMWSLAPWIENTFGVLVQVGWPSVVEWQRLVIVLAAATLISCIPAWRAYRNSLADGLSIRL